MGHMEFEIQAAQAEGGTRAVLLPPPARTGGMPLMEALARRHSSREFSARELPSGVLSSLLWAAFGINRTLSHRRTAPSAHDWEEMDVYAAMASGLYRYDAKAHALVSIGHRDLRALTGTQEYVASAPLDLVYVADLSRMKDAPAEDRQFYAGPDAGFIAQNVYLFCASEGLATVVRALIERPALAEAMALAPQQQIVLAQSVGYPRTPDA
jgi:nitroreductase